MHFSHKFTEKYSSLTSLVVQMVKHLSATQEAHVRSLDQEDPLEKEMVTHFSIIALEIPWIEGAWWATVHGVVQE